MEETIFEELRASGNLPTPAGVGMKILQLTRTDDYELDEMGHAIMTDSSLTGRILKLANSAAHAKARPATTVSESILRLGSSTVRDLCLAFSLVSERSAGSCTAFDYEGYWSTSLARAVVAQALSGRLGVGKPEEAYICGLLGDVGRLALASVFPDEYAAILSECLNQSPMSCLAKEKERFNIDHGQVAKCILQDWGLPETFAEAIQQSATQRLLEGGEKVEHSLSGILRVSEALGEILAADETASPTVWKRLGVQFERARNALDMGHKPFEAFVDGCIGEWINWGDSLDVGTHPQRRVVDLLRLVEERGGEAEDEAKPGPNSMSTPAPTPKPAPKTAPKTAPQTATAGVQLRSMDSDEEQVHILVIDDDPVSMKVLEMQLKKQGYKVTSCANSPQGLKIALETCPDIVVADWQMPEMDGMDLCRSLRRSELGRRMYFLLVTGKGEKDVIVNAFDAGVDDFITKPVLPEVLSARVKGGVRLVRLQRRVDHDNRIMKRQVAELGVLTRKLRATSLTDPLTELPNRRYAMKRLESEWSSTLRTGRDLSLVMIDIDHFKSVNDDYGHDVGDAVLKEAARRLKAAIRTSDEVCRIGGEEFLLICKNTAEDECSVVAERIRSSMADERMVIPGFDRDLTVSLGIAGYEPKLKSFNQLIKLADEALYAAKEGGRNRYICSADLDSRNEAA